MIEYIALSTYSLALILVGLHLFLGSSIFKYLFHASVVIGLISNIMEFVVRFAKTGQVPTSTVFDFFVMLSGAFAITYLVIYYKYRRPMIGLFIIPFPLICAALAIVVPMSEPSATISSSWRYIHLPSIILGSTFFIASFFASLMYFIQERQLKKKSFGFVFKRFPPLDTINKIIDMTLQFGFMFFTVGAVFGYIWVFSTNYTVSSVTKIVLASTSWLVFAVILLLKQTGKITPRQTAFWTIVGFLTILVSYVAVIGFLVG